MNSRYLPLAIEPFLEFKHPMRTFFCIGKGVLQKTSEQDPASLCSSRIRNTNGMDIPLRDFLVSNYENKIETGHPRFHNKMETKRWYLERNSGELYIETGLKINLLVLQLTPLKLHFQDQGGLRLEKCLKTRVVPFFGFLS